MQIASHTVQPQSDGAVLSGTRRAYMQLASHAVQPQSNGAVLLGTRRLYMQPPRPELGVPAEVWRFP